MNKDIRVALGFFDHRKTKKLVKKYGLEAAWGLLRLWAFAAELRPDGNLTGLSNADIALIMRMYDKADATELVDYMKSDDCRWLDATERFGVSLHGWKEYQPHLKIIAASKRPYSKAWKKIKAYILKRDNNTCLYCGVTQAQMECDHIFPISRGGNNSSSNLAAACPTCNRKKGTKTPDEWKRVVIYNGLDRIT